jgi:hypothetical protein
MTEQTIKTKLDQLADLQSAWDVAMLERQELIKKILTPEIEAAIQEIEIEFTERTEVVTGKIADLTAEVKAEVVKLGASVKGDYLQAVWSKPRVSWDTKALEGYAAAHPEIVTFRKVGAPSVSIRARA